MKDYPSMLGKPIDTWQAIAEHLGRTVAWLKTHRKEMFEQKVIFRKLVGRPPNRRVIVFTHSLLLEFWYMEKLESMGKAK